MTAYLVQFGSCSFSRTESSVARVFPPWVLGKLRVYTMPTSNWNGVNVQPYAEKRPRRVILSAAKDLLLWTTNDLQDSSSPSAPQNDSPGDFFSNLLVIQG